MCVVQTLVGIVRRHLLGQMHFLTVVCSRLVVYYDIRILGFEVLLVKADDKSAGHYEFLLLYINCINEHYNELYFRLIYSTLG